MSLASLKIISHFEMGLLKLSRLTSSSQSSCLTLTACWDYRRVNLCPVSPWLSVCTVTSLRINWRKAKQKPKMLGTSQQSGSSWKSHLQLSCTRGGQPEPVFRVHFNSWCLGLLAPPLAGAQIIQLSGLSS